MVCGQILLTKLVKSERQNVAVTTGAVTTGAVTTGAVTWQSIEEPACPSQYRGGEPLVITRINNMDHDCSSSNHL